MANEFVFNDGSGQGTPGTEASPPPLTGDALLDTYNTLVNQRLAVLQAGPSPSYNLHGHLVKWEEYLEYLDRAILQVMKELAQTRPLEQVGYSF